jgi:hypothetical protein
MPTSRKPTDLTDRKPGRDPGKMVDDLYRSGRHYPVRDPADWPARHAVNDYATSPGEPIQRDHGSRYHRHEEIQSPQHRPNQHDVHYDNDTSGWVRGAPNGQAPTGHNETAEKLPNFDHSSRAPRFNKSKGNDWGTADNRPAHQSSKQQHRPGEGPIGKRK